MYSISFFHFTFYLFGRAVRTHPTHPPAYGPVILSVNVRNNYDADHCAVSCTGGL